MQYYQLHGKRAPVLWHTCIATINAGNVCPENLGVAAGMVTQATGHGGCAALCKWLAASYVHQLYFSWACSRGSGNHGVQVATLPKPVRGAFLAAMRAVWEF